MADKDAITVWRRISKVISDEISSNGEFAQKILDAYGGDETISAPKRKNRRSPAKINPFELFDKGDECLSAALAELSVDELKDVIAAHGLDTSKLALKWKDRDRLERHIVEKTKLVASRGSAFWNS